jgi:hypothetical protein
MNYEISLYHLIPWQRKTTLVEESFPVEKHHSGVSALWNHLKASGNREIRTERFEDNSVIDLVRPVDWEYTLNWVFTTKYIRDNDKALFAQALTKMSGDRWLWFAFRRVRRDC